MSAIVHAEPVIYLSQQDALRIAVKIWYNESGGSIKGLTSWNKGEDFASVGIGHFVWYPARKYDGASGFPQFIRYLKKNRVPLPYWLQGTMPPCPWNTREEFLQDQYSPLMEQLRHFLAETIPWQAKFMVYRLNQALPQMLAEVPPEQRDYIRWQFYRVASTPQGVYALVDYVNFKGVGTGFTNNPTRGWGLLQVLQTMQFAPAVMTPAQAFAWSADQVLTRRVEAAPPYKFEERWLAGWRKRLRTYATAA